MSWLASLSSRQRLWLAVVSIAAVAIVVVGALRQEAADHAQPVAATVDMSMKQIAPQLGVTGKSLARELGLPLDIPKNEPLEALGVTEDQLKHVVHHLLGHQESTLKYYAFVALVLFALVFLVRLGRPDGLPPADRSGWYPRWPYVGALIIAVILCGFALGKSPNPMEGAVKVFKSFVGLYPSVTDKLLALAFFAMLAVVGNKLICGWACPFGALQELIFSLPLLGRLKKRKIPFAVSNTIRSALFVVVLLLLFGIVGNQRGLVIYHFVNPFNLFNLDIETASVGITICMALVLSLGAYRPFCQFICPFGLLSWLLERVSLFRVRIDRERCTQCGACIRACPLQAADGRVAGKRFAADCFSCARCLRACPEDALTYGILGRRKASTGAAPETR